MRKHSHPNNNPVMAAPTDRPKKAFGILPSMGKMKKAVDTSRAAAGGPQNSPEPPTLEQLAGITWRASSKSDASAEEKETTRKKKKEKKEKKKKHKQMKRRSSEVVAKLERDDEIHDVPRRLPSPISAVSRQESLSSRPLPPSSKKTFGEVVINYEDEPPTPTTEDEEEEDHPNETQTAAPRPRFISPSQQGRGHNYDMAPHLFNHSDTSLLRASRSNNEDPPTDPMNCSEPKLLRKKGGRLSKRRSTGTDFVHNKSAKDQKVCRANSVEFTNDFDEWADLSDSSSRMSAAQDIGGTACNNERADSPMPTTSNLSPIDDLMATLQFTKNNAKSFNLHPYPAVSSFTPSPRRGSGVSSDIEDDASQDSRCSSSSLPVGSFAKDPSPRKLSEPPFKAKQKRKPSQHGNARPQLHTSQSSGSESSSFHSRNGNLNHSNHSNHSKNDLPNATKDRFRSSPPIERFVKDPTTTTMDKQFKAKQKRKSSQHGKATAFHNRNATLNSSNHSKDPPERQEHVEDYERNRFRSTTNSVNPQQLDDLPEGGWGEVANKGFQSPFLSDLNCDLYSQLKQSLNSDSNSIATIEDQDTSFHDTVVNSAEHPTAEQLHNLIQMMQTEFQKLRSAKVNAEMKAQTLETDLVSLQQERDAEFMSLSEDIQKWKRKAQEENARCEGFQEEVKRLEDENLLLRKKVLKQYQKHEPSPPPPRSHPKETSPHTSSHDRGNIASSFATSGVRSRLHGSPLCYSSQPPSSFSADTQRSMSQPSSHRWQASPPSQHANDTSSDDHDALQAPSSWQEGKKTIKRLPKITPPLSGGAGITDANNCTNPASISPSRQGASFNRRSHFHRKTSACSNRTASTAMSTLRDSTISISTLRKNGEDCFDASCSSFDDIVVIQDLDNLVEEENLGSIGDCMRSGPF